MSSAACLQILCLLIFARIKVKKINICWPDVCLGRANDICPANVIKKKFFPPWAIWRFWFMGDEASWAILLLSICKHSWEAKTVSSGFRQSLEELMQTVLHSVDPKMDQAPWKSSLLCSKASSLRSFAILPPLKAKLCLVKKDFLCRTRTLGQLRWASLHSMPQAECSQGDSFCEQHPFRSEVSGCFWICLLVFHVGLVSLVFCSFGTCLAASHVAWVCSMQSSQAPNNFDSKILGRR